MKKNLVVGGRWKKHNHYDRAISRIYFIYLVLFVLQPGDEIKVREIKS